MTDQARGPGAPFLSFVATSRNDDHGGDVLRRTQSFVDGLARQCERHQLCGELVLVDWNPPQGRAPLADVLSWPAGGPWFSAKVVTVPREVHLRLPNARALGMYQMIAKNVGLRRAEGDYAVATNIDIVFSDELFDWLKGAALNSHTLYRSDRWDIPNPIQLEPDLDVLLGRARDEAIRKNLADGTHIRVDGAWKSEGLARVDRYLLGSLEGALKHSLSLLEQGYRPDTELRQVLDELLPRSRQLYLTPSSHLNGCGDFTMLSRDGWRKLRGYPEWPIFSWNIDSVAMVHAAYEGFALSVAPSDAVHYHIEHDYGSGYTPGGGMDALLRRLTQRGTPLLDWAGYQELLLTLARTYEAGGSLRFNDDDWGFAADALPERVCAAEGLPPRPARAPNVGKLEETFASDGLSSVRLEAWEAQGADRHEIAWEHGAPSLRIVQARRGEAVRWMLPTGGSAGARTLWLRLFLRLRDGRAALRVEDAAGTLLREMSQIRPGDGRREVILCVPGEARSLSISALTPPMEADVGCLDIFASDEPAPDTRTGDADWITFDAAAPLARVTGAFA